MNVHLRNTRNLLLCGLLILTAVNCGETSERVDIRKVKSQAPNGAFKAPVPIKKHSPPSNAQILTCANNFDSHQDRFSLSPSGDYVMELIDVQQDRDGRYRKNGKSYPPLHVFDLKEVNAENSLEAGFVRRLNLTSRLGVQGFAWLYDDKIVFKDTQRDKDQSELYSILDLSNIDAPIQPIGSGGSFYNSSIALETVADPVDFNNRGRDFFINTYRVGGWQRNAFRKPSVRLYSKKGESPGQIQVSQSLNLNIYADYNKALSDWRKKNWEEIKSKSPTRSPRPVLNNDIDFKTILSFDKLRDRVTVLENDVFQPAIKLEHNLNSIHSDISPTDYFYYLSNVNRNSVSLLKYTDSEGEGGNTEVYTNKAFDVNHVSLNRLGDQVRWTVIDKGFPHHIIFDEQGQNIFDLIDMPSPHFSKIVSENIEGSRAIVKRESFDNGIEYILVDTADKSTKLLSACLGNGASPWAGVEEISFTASDGVQVWGQMYRPKDSKQAAPTIVYAHGGPSFQQKLAWDNLYFKSLVERGYNVVAINYRGSLGYGREFREQGWVNFERARHDLIEAGKYASKLNGVDAKNIFLMGNSFGGYLALSVATSETHPFKAVVSRNGMTDLNRFLTESFTLSDGSQFKYNDVSDVFGDINDPENKAYLKLNSPASAVGKFNTPIFMAHGKRDSRVPFSQSQSFYDAVKVGDPDLQVRFVPLAGGHAIDNLDTLKRYIDESIGFVESVSAHGEDD